MKDNEKLLVDQTMTAIQQHQWATERCVERLANLIWDLRGYLPLEHRMRIEYVLSHIPRLEKVYVTGLRDGSLRDPNAEVGPSRWILMCEWPTVPFCPADPFRYDESLRKLCEIMTGVEPAKP